MTTPMTRLKRGATALAAVFFASVIGYRMLGGYDWIEAVWMVVVTFSTVGYGEKSNLGYEVQLLTIGVIVLGVSLSAYLLGALIQYLLEGELERVLGRRRMDKEISKLRGHVIVCGYGRTGEDLVAILKKRQIPTVVVDHDLDRIDEVVKENGLVVSGDATSESVLEQANLEHAKAIVTTLPTDAQNVFIALTARNLAPNVQIIATAEEASSCRKLRQAGANKIVMPQRVGAQQMERMITRPTAADLFELVAETSDMEMELDELVIGPGSHLFGKTIGDSGLRDEYGLLVIGIKKPDGRLVFNPPSSQVIEADDTLIVIGSFNKIAKLKATSGA